MSKYLVVLLFFLILGISTVVIVQNIVQKRNTVIRSEIVPTQTPLKIDDQPRIYLQREEGVLYRTGQPIIVSIYGNSKGKPLVGYDIVLQYDKNKAEYMKYENQNPNFEVFARPSDNQLLLTGIKSLDREPFILENVKLAEVTFTPISGEPLEFGFEFLPGNKKDTNLIDADSADVLHSVQGMTLKPAQVKTLRLNDSVPLSGGLVATLTKVELAQSLCLDCLSQATVEIQNGVEIEELVFRFGGIVGFHESSAEAFGYTFELATLQTGAVELLYGK